MKIIFSKKAETWLKKADATLSKRIAQKLLKYCESKDPLAFAKLLTTKHFFKYYRFRIGEYRAIFTVEEGTLIIIKIGHRKNVYKKVP